MKMSKKGQVTLFIILGIVIIAAAVLIFIFFPDIQSTLGFAEESPNQFLQRCIEDKIVESVNLVSLQGGSITPGNHYLYQNNRIEYLCYTNENFVPCVMQEPFLQQHIEDEIKGNIESDFQACLSDFDSTFRGRGFNVQREAGDFRVELLPNLIITTFDGSVSLTKGEDTQRFESIRVVVNNNIYELVSVVNSILNWEATYGDAETTTYMNYYRDLKVEKLKQGDGSKVYILSDRNSDEKFQFATRSVVFPPGYGVGQ